MCCYCFYNTKPRILNCYFPLQDYQIKQSYDAMGFVASVYNQYTLRGFDPKVFPLVVWSPQDVFLAIISSKCWFQISLVSRLTLKYLTSSLICNFLQFAIESVLLGRACQFISCVLESRLDILKDFVIVIVLDFTNFPIIVPSAFNL